jgi:hypothetical protein
MLEILVPTLHVLSLQCFICSMYILNWLELSKISIDLSVYVPGQKKLYA